MEENNESLDMEQAESVVSSQEEEGQQVEDQGQEAEDEKAEQSHEDNHRYQSARQQGERSGYERGIREANARIARAGMRNPSDGSPISDLDGLEAFGTAARQARISKRAKEEGRSEAEIAEEEADREYVHRARRQEEAQTKQSQAQQAQAKWIAADAQAFVQRFPNVDLEALDNNKAFRKFCGSRYGKEPLGDLYQDWTELTGSAERAGQAKGASKQARETGAGSGSGSGAGLSSEQQKALDEWNHAYPSMKMTAKEFLSR